jgi:excisionase family DNA binding protein
MSTRPAVRNLRPSSPPPVSGALVPPQASGPEPGPPADRLAYSVDEAAHLTGLSRDLLYDEMRQGHLDFLKVGRRRLITRQQLEQFLGVTLGLQAPAPSGATSDPKTATDGH